MFKKLFRSRTLGRIFDLQPREKGKNLTFDDLYLANGSLLAQTIVRIIFSALDLYKKSWFYVIRTVAILEGALLVVY